jgi:phosphoenolpyruvate carboxylase
VSEPALPPKTVQENLSSRSAITVARQLTDYLFEALRNSPVDAEIDHAKIADRLVALRERVWQKEPIPEEQRNEAFKDALKDLNEKELRVLAETYARMGELFEVAGLTARENTYKKPDDTGEKVLDTAEKFVSKEVNISSAIEKLGVPVFSPVLTMHPTNIQGLEPMKALRAVSNVLHGKAVKDADGKTLSLEDAIRNYQHTGILHTDKDGREVNLTVREETQTALNYLGNIYEDMSGIYKKFDEGLAGKFKEHYNALDLKLKAELKSWASAGDKDGNDNVTAEKTLEAMIRHTHDIVGRYAAELKAPPFDNITTVKSDVDEGVIKWRNTFDQKHTQLEGLLKKAEALTDATDTMRKPDGNKADATMYAEQFDTLSKELAALRDMIKVDEFEKDLQTIYNKIPAGEQKDKVLELTRKVRWFGKDFAKIEYRETAEEYAKVMDKLIDGYSEMEPDKRIEKLTELLSNDLLPVAITQKVQSILSNGAGKSLGAERSENATDAIAYHTLKRMELARDHNGMIKDMVLAECGKIDLTQNKYKDLQPKDEDKTAAKAQKDLRKATLVADQGVANMLEAQLLQRLVQKDGKKPLLGVVPLFEDPETMQNIDRIMGGAYKNTAYHAHLQELADDRCGGKLTQQVQIAHSDNRRRAGSLAGTAFIHEAHAKMRVVNQNSDIQTQFFEGGSQADAFRNGVRAISAQVNAYNLQDFAKFTFQGRDLQNYFNHPGSIERLFSNHYAHAASRLEKSKDGWNVIPPTFDGGEKDREPNSILDEIAIAALKRTKNDYAKEDFSKDALGTLLAALGSGYDSEAKAGNRGSRAAARGPAFAGGAKVAVGAVVTAIEVDKLRTIPFSMMPQQNRLTLSWVGGQNLEKYLKEEILKRQASLADTNNSNDIKIANAGGDAGKKKQKDIDAFLNKFSDIDPNQSLPPQLIHMFYDKSPAFRDAMDKAAFAVARTDLVAVDQDINSKENAPLFGQVFKSAKNYLDEILKPAHASMGNLVYAALTGDTLMQKNNQSTSFSRYTVSGKEQAWTTQALQDLNKLGQEITLKNNYQDFTVFAKNSLNQEGRLNDNMLAIFLAGGLTSTHSRWLGADDKEFGQHKGQTAQTSSR